MPETTQQERIYLSPPCMRGRERELMLDAFDSNWIAPLGPHVNAFENEFAARLGESYSAAALSSGTGALHLALKILGVQQGDEVITASFTFTATANSITYVGASPVFLDSDSTSWNIDPNLLEAELADCKTRGKMPAAVMTVDILGQCADYKPIQEICRKYGVPIIEDAAESLGATYDGKPAGTFGDVACFSFNGNKIITTSGGGMLVTRDSKQAELARHLATQARDPAPHYEHTKIGYNYRMSNIVAAIGRGQLECLDDIVLKRRAIFAKYQAELGGLPGIEFMPEIENGQSTRWLTCALINAELFGATNDEIRLALERQNIESRPAWKPMHMQPVFSKYRTRGGAVSEKIFQQGISLPSGTSLTEPQQERVIACIRGMAK